MAQERVLQKVEVEETSLDMCAFCVEKMEVAGPLVTVAFEETWFTESLLLLFKYPKIALLLLGVLAVFGIGLGVVASL